MATNWQCICTALPQRSAATDCYLHSRMWARSVGWLSQGRSAVKESLKTLPENCERLCWSEVRRWANPQIGGRNWEGGSEVERRQSQLLRVGWWQSRSRWNVSSVGEVGRQIRDEFVDSFVTLFVISGKVQVRLLINLAQTFSIRKSTTLLTFEESWSNCKVETAVLAIFKLNIARP